MEKSKIFDFWSPWHLAGWPSAVGWRPGLGGLAKVPMGTLTEVGCGLEYLQEEFSGGIAMTFLCVTHNDVFGHR